MNPKHARNLLISILPLSLPLLAACTGPIDDGAEGADTGDDSVGVAAQPLMAPPMGTVSAGNLASFAVRSDGTLVASGDNIDGQLGDGSTVQRESPGPVSGLSGVTAVSAGLSNFTLALMSDKTLRSWGANSFGQLGNNGTPADQTTPVQVSLLSGVTAMAAANLHGLAVTSDGVTPDGTVWAWGINGSGQLGDNSTTERHVPVRVSGLSGATAVAGGRNYSLALMADKTVFAWGSNADGQLGDTTYTERHTPVQVGGALTPLTGVKAVAAGWLASYALKEDGTVWAWGDTTYPSLSCPPAADPTVPAQIAGLSSVVALAVGVRDMLALKEDGTVVGMGRNGRGQLGDGTNHERCAPVPVAGLSGVTAIAVGQYHSMAQTSNGTVFTFGANSDGQLGDGTLLDRRTPVPTTFNGGPDCVGCAGWPMPNPVSTGLPHPASYTTRTGSVVDDVTGLEWQQAMGCSAGCTQADAAAYCEGLTLAGQGDWRLPTRIELVSLVDDTQHLPAIDTTWFPGTSNAYSWTSSAALINPSNAFIVGGAEGDTSFGAVTGLAAARCVRAPAGEPASQYVILGGGTPTGTVQDTGTWLTWQQQVSPDLYTFDDAIAYCAANAAGLPGTGWRLPSMKELQTIVDDHHVLPTMDPTAFPGAPSLLQTWSSTPVGWQSGHAWFVRFNDGKSSHDVVSAAYNVRCVR